jgi:RNA polymerase II subunit A small phosphatase-like protein
MKHRKNVILDLDNTILSAESMEDFPFHKPEMKEKALKFTIHDMDGYYIIFERPRVQEFLDYLFANFNVSVWTAASKDYALFVIENIILAKPDRQLSFIFFSYHCKISKNLYNRSSKNLKLIWEKFYLGNEFNAKNTIIIDDLPEVCESQPKNCIAIYPFEILEKGSENDNVLMTDIKPQLEKFLVK